MNQVQRHYDDLLASHYSWMTGLPFDEKVAEQQALLSELGVGAGPRRCAVDLGCGPGYQAVALANLGYETVMAVDLSPVLLEELRGHDSGKRITTIAGDLRAIGAIAAGHMVDAVVCMGDTLTHLESRSDVRVLFKDAYDSLVPGGHLVLTFRDLSAELTDLDRFIPVRAEHDRIMTCVLEYEPETVIVTDLIYVREDHLWTLRKSSYRKLRLSPADMTQDLREAGFVVEHDLPKGRMHAISARRA